MTSIGQVCVEAGSQEHTKLGIYCFCRKEQESLICCDDLLPEDPVRVFRELRMELCGREPAWHGFKPQSKGCVAVIGLTQTNRDIYKKQGTKK